MKGLESFLMDQQNIVSLVTKAEIIAMILSLVPYKGLVLVNSHQRALFSRFVYSYLCSNPPLHTDSGRPPGRGEEFQMTVI